MKQLLITHNDLDGVGCAVIFHKCFPTDDIIFVEAGQADQPLMEHICRFDKVWVTDLSPSKECVEEFKDNIDGERLCSLISVVDHHASALWLNSYLWATVDTTMSATLGLWHILKNDFFLDDLKTFAELVSDHDLYTHKIPGSLGASNLLWVMGLQPFFERLCNNCKIGPNGLFMTDGEKLLLECDNYLMMQYYELLKEKAQLFIITDYKIVCAFAEQYISQCSHMFLTDYEDIEAVFLIDMLKGKINMRSKGNFNCAEYAMTVGGGGHLKAAGFPIDTASMMAQMWGIKDYVQ